MRNITKTKLYDLAPNFWTITLFSLISIAFIVSDWVIFYSSFGDFVLAITAFLFLILGQVTLSKKQLLAGTVPLFFLALNVFLNVNFNDYWFDTTRAFLSTMKIGLYLSVLLLVYNFIKRKNLYEYFLKISNIYAVSIIVIGIILTLLIYFNRDDIYLVLWTFTRTDTTSYLFNDNENIVRMRSLFSEPAHLGYYLNTILFANVFSGLKKNKWVIGTLVIGILLTLSYSMIIILLATGSTYLITRLLKKDIKWHKWYLLALLPMIAGILFFWDFVQVTIIQRTVDILTGSDGSAYNRIVESWIYLENERIIFGNGVAHSPPITNIYAYLLTDFGLVGFIPYVGFTLFILFSSVTAFVFFFLMNNAKGGYLNPAFWLFLLYVFTFCIKRFDKRTSSYRMFKKRKQ